MHKTTTVLAALAIGAAAIATSIAPGNVGTVVGIAVVAALALGGLMLASLGRAARDLEDRGEEAVGDGPSLTAPRQMPAVMAMG